MATLKKKIGFYAIFLAIFGLAPIIILELVLRAFFGFPHGSFNYLLSAKDGLYPRNSTVIMDYGFKPYTVKTNSYGMRGKDVAFRKTEGVTRIVALGDSVTDGYFVDNEGTYPYLLDKALSAQGLHAEVLNVAHGGGSIDKEYALLRLVMPLKPDIVILTFVTNDISEIRGKSKEELLHMKMRSVPKQMPEWLLTKTAIGELIGDLKLRLRYKNYRLSSREKVIPVGGVDNDTVRRDYEWNVRFFKSVSTMQEGLVMAEPFSDDTQKLIANYLFALADMKKFCDANNARLILVYFPSYIQIYEPAANMRMRDILREACVGMGAPFLDLTAAFRRVARSGVFHLVPYDFHCNEKGNKIIADSIAGFLIEEKIH